MEDFLAYMNSVDPAEIPIKDRDDGNYDRIKYTVIPAGTQFRFRSKDKVRRLQSRPIWADYSHTLGKESFLDEDEDYSKGMEYYFGEWMNTIELLQDMTIIHMPVNYDRITAPRLNRRNTRKNPNNSTKRIRRNLNVTAEMEAFVRLLCIHTKRERAPPEIGARFRNYSETFCRDGYTMDFFYRIAGPAAKKFKEIREKLFHKMAGFREICLTNVTPETVKLVKSEFKPVL